MSRGGRGGAALNSGMRMRGQPLPFLLDPEIEEEVERTLAADSSDDNVNKELYPEIDLVPPAPPTDEERDLIRLYRIRRVKMKSSPFWTGDPGAYDPKTGDPNMPGGFNPFEGAPTYTNSKRKRTVVTPNLRGVKNIYPHLFPKELHHLFEDNTTLSGAEGRIIKRPKRLALARQTVKDKLAKFDENDAEDFLANEDNDEVGEEENKNDENNAEGEDPLEQPVDDTYEEDEDDVANDYNAEAYFDDGEGDFEDVGGEEYGDDGY